MKPSKWIWCSCALAGFFPLAASTALAQNNTNSQNPPAPAASKATSNSAQSLPTVLIWDAQGTSMARIGPWGNGSAQVNKSRTGSTLLVKTLNLDEGVRFDLLKPVELVPYRQTGFWRIKFQNSGTVTSGGGRRTRGGRGRTQAGSSTQGTAPLTQLRLKIELEEGVMSGYISLPRTTRGTRGSQWQNLLLPIKRMFSSPNAHGAVRRIILTGDSTASFNLEQIALVAETSRITATLRRVTDAPGTEVKTVTVKPGRSTTLVADVEGGTADLNVAWNFNADNSVAFPPSGSPAASTRSRTGMGATRANGVMARPRVDAVGLNATPNWPNEEQDYRVEVTVSDRAGKKATVKKSLLVQVRGGN